MSDCNQHPNGFDVFNLIGAVCGLSALILVLLARLALPPMGTDARIQGIEKKLGIQWVTTEENPSPFGHHIQKGTTP